MHRQLKQEANERTRVNALPRSEPPLYNTAILLPEFLDRKELDEGSSILDRASKAAEVLVWKETAR
jgi:hypothetical protein